MKLVEFFKGLTDRLQCAANVKTIYGDPIEMKDKTIIPVARVSYGFGGGHSEKEEENGVGGGGGGVVTQPVGYIEINKDGTHYTPIDETRKLLISALAGAVVCALIITLRPRLSLKLGKDKKEQTEDV